MMNGLGLKYSVHQAHQGVGALERPNNIIVHLYNSSQVLNVIFHLSISHI